MEEELQILNSFLEVFRTSQLERLRKHYDKIYLVEDWESEWKKINATKHKQIPKCGIVMLTQRGSHNWRK